MGIFINILLGLCTLHILADFNTTAYVWTKADGSGAAARITRAVNKPTPIDCKLGSWSSWTPCTSCTDTKLHFRYIEKPSQFGGTDCHETLWESLQCPTASMPCLVPDLCGESFTCNETDRCISQSLRCNGEQDCQDFSDEEGCETYNRRDDKCSTFLTIPGANDGTQGYNILTGEFANHVLDPKYFGGQCEYVYNGEWRKFTYDSFCENLHYNEDEKNFRKPYNYHTYRFVAQAKSEGSTEYYEDMVDLLKARRTKTSSSGGFSLGISYVKVGVSGSSESDFLKNITQYKSQNLGFIRLFSKVQSAHFKIRSNKLMLHEDFYVSLMELPELYDFGMYSRFFNTFGTHYVTEGYMGGTLEYIVVTNKTAMAESKMEGEQFGSCIGGSFGLSYDKVSFSLGGKSCGKDGTFDLEKKSSSAMIEDVVTMVNGGVTHTSIGLMAIRNPETYKRWGTTIKSNPSLIEYEIMPIYELVRLSTAADDGLLGARLANLQRGWDEYLQQFHPCRCAPCRHNGVPVLTGTSCSCLCKSGYRGLACEETSRRDATSTDGSWSCWGAWSSCTSGRKTRTRACNNPTPEGGGATCLGSSSQNQRC